MSLRPKQHTVSDVFKKLAENLDVPESRAAAAERSYKSLGSWLERPASELHHLSPSVYVQGSFSLGTAIRPLADDDHYDIDVVCEVNWDKDTRTQYDLKTIIGKEVKGYASSKNLEDPACGRRCWTLNYADKAQFHMDVLPAVPDGLRQRNILIEGRLYSENLDGLVETAISITDEQHPYFRMSGLDWLGSNPRGYQKWFHSKMAEVYEERLSAIALHERKAAADIPSYRVKTTLQQSVQLLKRHRDVMFSEDEQNVKPISVIISTLAAQAYNQERELVPALAHIVDHLHEYIDNQGGVYRVQNPVDPRENFADKWDDYPERKDAFFEWLETVRNDVHASIDIETTDQFLENVSPVLGPSLVEKTIGSMFSGAVIARGITEEVRKTVIDAPHKKGLQWPLRNKYSVTISNATASRNGFRNYAIESNGPSLMRNQTLWFRAQTDVPKPFEIYWQVVNTGPTAAQANQLRGGFDKGLIEKGRLKKKESTSYPGAHSIECLIVKDGYCVARSGPFIVNIG